MSSFFKLNKHVHVNKDKIKAAFDINVKKVTHLEEYNGKPVNLSWKRGKRPINAGTLKDVVVNNGEAIWDEKITVQVTLFKESGVDKFDEKSLVLQLSQVFFLLIHQRINHTYFIHNIGMKAPFDISACREISQLEN